MIDPDLYGENAHLINLTKRPEHSCSSYQISAASLPGVDYGRTSAVASASTIGVAVHTADLVGENDSSSTPSVFTFNSVYGNWAEAKSFTPPNREPNKAYATLNEQSQRVIAGVVALPETLQAEPATNQQSSIAKPLDQVSPDDGYLKIGGVEPDSKGAYSVDLPLLLRPSRGPGPSFSVRYTSGGATGVLGRGWDLSFSSVEVRGPSPIYHPDYETEDYLLDGTELIALDGDGRDIPPLYKGGPIIPRVAGERVFRLRNNSSGLIVRRRGNDPNNYFWEVWNPNTQVTRLYGAKLQHDGSLAIDETSNAQLRGVVRFSGGHGNTVIGQWGLTQEYDNQPARSGSTYSYEHTDKGARCQSASWGGECWASLRLKAIDYNQAFGGTLDGGGKWVPISGWERGATTVLFDWEERELARFISDGRLGFLQAQEFWLRQINVVYAPASDNSWLSAANQTVAVMAKELRPADRAAGAKAENGVLKSIEGKVVFSSHAFVLGDEDAPCMNYERVLKAYRVWANPLVDGPLAHANAKAPRDEVQTFSFDYKGETKVGGACTAQWADEPQNVEASMAGEIGLNAPEGKLDFPTALITDLGLDLLQQRSLLGTGRTKETGGSLYVGVGPNDGRLTSKPITGGIKGGTTFTKSESNSTLVDVTGDGIDDILYRGVNGLRYCAGQRDPADKFRMSYKRCGRVVGPADSPIEEFSSSDTSTLSVSAEGFFPANSFAAVGFNQSENSTDIYFTEQDGDGLVDLVTHGRVLYGQGEERPATGEPVVRFLPSRALTPPVPGQIAKSIIQARVPTQLRETIRLVETRLAQISRKLEQLSYSQTTLSWESPLDGIVSIGGKLEFDSVESSSDVWPDDILQAEGALPRSKLAFTPSEFAALPAKVKPFADNVAAKAKCLTWTDEPACHQQVSDPFTPGYDAPVPAGFDFIHTPPSFLQVSIFRKAAGGVASPCTPNEPIPERPDSLDLATINFVADCQPATEQLGFVGDGRRAKLIRVAAGDVIHVTFSVHPHFGKRIRPELKLTYEDVDGDPVFRFLKYGALTNGGTREGIEKAIRCSWKDPAPVKANDACRLAGLTRYTFDLSAGALTSSPGSQAVLPKGIERAMRGAFTFPDLRQNYDVFVDLVGAETTDNDASRTVVPDGPPLKRIDASTSCTNGECQVDISTFCTWTKPSTPCIDILNENTSYVLALRLTILHKGTQIAARDLNTDLASLRWSEAPAIVSKFTETTSSDKPNLTAKGQDKTIVYLPVTMGDPDLEFARIKDGRFDNPDNGLEEDKGPPFKRINFAQIQDMEDQNVELARKRQTVDLCRFAREIATFLEGRIDPHASPFATDFSGYWTSQLDDPDGRYGKRCIEAEKRVKYTLFTGATPDKSINDALRLPQILGKLEPGQQIASAQLLIGKVFDQLDAGEELLTDNARMTRRGYRLPAKINPLSCKIISSAGEPIKEPLTSSSLDDLCAYRVLANFAMLDFKDGGAPNAETWFSEFSKKTEAAFELTMTATVDGVPVPFRELTGEAAGNDDCQPTTPNANTCTGVYGVRAGDSPGYAYPDPGDDVFQRVTVNKRAGRAAGFSSSIMQAKSPGLAECKRMPDYATSSEMERKQDCERSGPNAIEPDLKYVSSTPDFAVTYQITEANKFLGRNRIFEFQGHPLGVAQFHIKLTPKLHLDVQTKTGETIRGRFSLFENQVGRQMIRRSAADILADDRTLACPPYPSATAPFADPKKTVHLPATCRPWTKLGWTELLLGAQYRTYSDATRTGLAYQFSIKRRREILRLFPEIEVAAEQYSISDQIDAVPTIDGLKTGELAIAGTVRDGARVILTATEPVVGETARTILKGMLAFRPLANLIDITGVELWAAELVAANGVAIWGKTHHVAKAFLAPSPKVQAITAPTAFLVFDRFQPHVPKVGGSWAFFARQFDGKALSLPRDFHKARFASNIYEGARQGKENAYASASASCGTADEPNFEGCGDHLGEEGQEVLRFADVTQIPLVHRFAGPATDDPAISTSQASVCASELPNKEANCWQGFDDTVLLESGISRGAKQEPLFSMSALIGFERPPIAEFLSEFGTLKDVACLDRDWTGTCKKDGDESARASPTEKNLPPARPDAAPADALVEVFAPIQRSESETVSFNGGAAFVNASKSRTNRRTLTTYQDVNGDGYPELISNGVAELTSPVGLSRRDWWKYFRIRPGTDGLAKERFADGMGTGAASRSEGTGIGLSPSTAALFDSRGTNRNENSGSPDPNVEPSFEFNAESGNDLTFTELRDFNGDGLADSVTGSTVDNPLTLAYNAGNSLVPRSQGAFTAGGVPAQGVFYNTSHSAGFGVRLGYSTESGSFAAGMGLSHRDSGSQGALLDFTGDGRPDIVVPVKGGLIVHPNLGNGFGKGRLHLIPNWTDSATSYSETTLVDGGAQFTYGFAVWLVKVVFNPGIKHSRNQTRELLQIRDINGDGMPDIASVSGAFGIEDGGLIPKLPLETELKANVRYNPDAGYHFLSGIKTPTGAEFVLRQDLFGNEGPYQGRPVWALTEVARYDGFKSDSVPGLATDGQDVLLTRYAYENGYFNRAEHQFYGFDKRTSTSYGCDEDSPDASKQNRCLVSIKTAAKLDDDVLARAGFKPLREIVERFSNRDLLTQGTLLSQTVRGAISSPDATAGTGGFSPVSRTVFGYSIDSLQCINNGATDCTGSADQSSGRWTASYFSDQLSALSHAWDGSIDYADNGRVFGGDQALCPDIGTCADRLQNRVTSQGFDREQKTFWAQQSGSVRQRFVRLEIVAPTANEADTCDFDADASCVGKSGLKSAIAFDHDNWGQVLRLNNIAEAGPDWKPVEASSNHVDVAFARLLSSAVEAETELHKRRYPLLGLATSVQVFDQGWRKGDEQPIRMREAVYPTGEEDKQADRKFAGRGLPTEICLYPGAKSGFDFAPGICRKFSANLEKALDNGQHTMQSALKYAYEVDEAHLPVGGATTSDAVIRYQLVDYDDYGNLTHSVSPLSRSMDWVERVFRYTEDPFKTTATETELTRCVKREPGAGDNSPHLPDLDKQRCSFGLEVLPELVRNVGVTHYSHSRVDTHSGMVAEVTDINGNGLLYDFDRWSRLRLIARRWGNAPRENKTFAQELKRAVAKTDAAEIEADRKPGTDGNPDPTLSATETMGDVTDWRILALADYSCMAPQEGKVVDNCRSIPTPDGVLRSNLRRFESADTYSGLLHSGNTTRESAVFADGYGRPIQTLSEADVCLAASSSLFDPDRPKNVAATAPLAARCSRPGNGKASGIAGIIVRPSTAIDALGRDLMSFEPYAPTDEPAPRVASAIRLDRMLVAPVEPAPLTKSAFDGAGRPLTIASRLASRVAGAVTGTTQFRYRIQMQAGQAARFETLTFSPRCSAGATWMDSRGMTTNVFEGQAERYRIGDPDADAGIPPSGADRYDRRLARTAEPCAPIADLAAGWTKSAVHTEYAYDSLQQLKRVDYPFKDETKEPAEEAANTSITVNYDLLGRTVQMQERNSGCTRYAYDALNLLTSEAGYRFEPGKSPICGDTFQARNEKSYTYSGDRLKSIAYHSLDEQGGVPDSADTATFYYDRYPFASLSGTPVEADKYVLNDQANQHLIDVTGRFCDNCIGQATLVSDRSGARTYSYNELGLVRRELRSIVGSLDRVVKSAGEAETSVPELAAYEVENSYTAFGDIALEEFTESAPANPAEACVKNGVDTCLSRFSIGRRYSPDGALAEMRFNGKTIVSSAQDALGRPAVRWTANGSMTGYRYDPTDLRLNQMTTLTGADQRVQMVEYQYDGGGNILDYRNRAAAATDYDSAFAFIYDPVNRLQLFKAAVSASLDGAMRKMSADGRFGYDARHRFTDRSLNITEAGQTFGRSWTYEYDATKGPFHAPKSVTFSLGTYPVGSKPVLQPRTTEFRYDEIGRMIGASAPGEADDKASAKVISNRTMNWDGQGRLIHVRGLEDKAANDNAKWLREHYTYDAGGNRVLKMHQPDVFEPAAPAKQGAAENAQPAKPSKPGADAKPRKIEAATIYMTPYYARPYNARGTVQLSPGTLPSVSMAAPADESEDPVATYLYADLPVGSITAAVTAYGEPDNAAATMIARREYDPYGLPLTSEALAKSVRGDLPPVDIFHGKELDRVTGFSSFGTRYYSRDVGLWLSPDPETYVDRKPQIAHPRTMAVYAGFALNPTIKIDPDGQDAASASRMENVREQVKSVNGLTNKQIYMTYSPTKIASEVDVGDDRFLNMTVDTKDGRTDLDWALTLAYYSEKSFLPPSVLYPVGKTLWAFRNAVTKEESTKSFWGTLKGHWNAAYGNEESNSIRMAEKLLNNEIKFGEYIKTENEPPVDIDALLKSLGIKNLQQPNMSYPGKNLVP
ncbi:SpvB/TcaC N-terminal domain-containing protein [Mesorhizobium sp. CA16]|uniref:SpvB/TcaC N-terminal domain-containing protein n=1 Tax=Mesorhizobium sp. CA16 TaxID=588496 RepID=UPI001CCFD2BA|nr:SpvB/TcaC N-terminal domain-containing protein [Mesorhizobium sp. CA16]MBZ9911384.1 hypothetical protein [Mesorhizobium sp. CA16]